jgi:hypothetical protein
MYLLDSKAYNIDFYYSKAYNINFSPLKISTVFYSIFSCDILTDYAIVIILEP